MSAAVPPAETSLSAEAERVLVDQRARFFEFIRRRVGAPEIAEDILQEATRKALERGGQLRAEESIVAWFFRILRSAIIDHHRRHAAAGRALEQWGRELDTAAGRDELEREVCRCVAGVLDTLKPEYQAPLRAIDLGGKNLEAFAEEAHITTNNAAVRLHRARQALGKRLKATCGACAEHGCVDCTCAH